MIPRICIVLILSFAAAQAQPSIPDTPAGHTFKAWIEAFNSGDQAQMDAYYQKYEPGKKCESHDGFPEKDGRIRSAGDRE